MEYKYLFYCCILCPLEDVRGNIRKGRLILKSIIDITEEYGDAEGVTFFELTEEALKNMPAPMIDKMKRFTNTNIDTMVFNIKELKCTGENVENLKSNVEKHIARLTDIGFQGEILIVKEVRNEELNIGKTVGKKGYEIYYHMQYLK